MPAGATVGPAQGGQGGSGSGNRRRRGQAQTLATLLNPNSTAEGKDLLKLARALTKIEIKPQVNAYKRLVKELRGQQTADTLGLRNLGNQTATQIGGAYQGADAGAAGSTLQASAIGQMLNQQQAAAQGQAAAQQAQTQSGQLGGLQEAMALRGAPGGGQAQQALQTLVNQQAARSAAEGQASATAAAAQGANYAGLSNAQRQATAQQGATALSDTARLIASRIAENKLTTGQDIREAQGKKADVKALKGAKMLEVLSTLRESERDFLLGKAATKQDRRALKSSEQQAALDRAADQEDREDEQAFDAAQQEDAQAAELEQEAAGDQNEPSTQNDEGGDRGERRRDRKAARQAARDLAGGQSVEYLQANFAAFVAQIKEETGVDRIIARAAARQYIQSHS